MVFFFFLFLGLDNVALGSSILHPQFSKEANNLQHHLPVPTAKSIIPVQPTHPPHHQSTARPPHITGQSIHHSTTPLPQYGPIHGYNYATRHSYVNVQYGKEANLRLSSLSPKTLKSVAPTYQNIRSPTLDSQKQELFETTQVNDQKRKLIQSPQSSQKQQYYPQSQNSPNLVVSIPSYNYPGELSVHPPRYQASHRPNFQVNGHVNTQLLAPISLSKDNYKIASTTAHNAKSLTLKVITELHLNESVENKDVQEGRKIPQNLIGKLYSSKTKPPSIQFELVEQENYKLKQYNLILANTNPYNTRVLPAFNNLGYLKQVEPSYVHSLHFKNKAKQSLKVRFEKVS